MIGNTNIEITGLIINPDKTSLREKSMIDISMIRSDISASNSVDDIKLNFNQTEIVLLDDETTDKYDTYFTPIYTEKISYTQWKKTINKSFQELEIE